MLRDQLDIQRLASPRLLRRRLAAFIAIALLAGLCAQQDADAKRKKSDDEGQTITDPESGNADANAKVNANSDADGNPDANADKSGALLYGSASQSGGSMLQGSSWASANPYLSGSAWESARPRLRGRTATKDGGSFLSGSARDGGSFLSGSARDGRPFLSGEARDGGSFLSGSAQQTAPFALDAQQKRFRGGGLQSLAGIGDPLTAKSKKVLYKGFLQMNCLEFNELGANYYTAERNYRGVGIKYGISTKTAQNISSDATVNFGGRDHAIQMSLPAFRGGQVFLYSNDQHLIAIDPRTYDAWVWQPQSPQSDVGATWKKLTHRKPKTY